MSAEAKRVRDYMVPNVLSVLPSTEIMHVIHLFAEEDVSGVPVVDEAGTVVGIVTERDCIRVAIQAGYHDEVGGAVASFMTTPVHTVSPEESIVDLAQFFAESPFRRCPVVEDGRLVGMICRRDVLKALASGAWFAERR